MNASECYASFKKTGYVCGGCNKKCRMSTESAKWLKGFIEKVDPGRQIKNTRL